LRCEAALGSSGFRQGMRCVPEGWTVCLTVLSALGCCIEAALRPQNPPGGGGATWHPALELYMGRSERASRPKTLAFAAQQRR